MDREYSLSPCTVLDVEALNAVNRHVFLISHVYSQPFFRQIPFFNTFPKRKILGFAKLKEFADDNFKFDKKWQKVFKTFRNTVIKGEIARYEQFLLLSQCLQKTCTADT